MRRWAAAALAVLLLAAAAPAVSAAACPRASLPNIESQVMCLVCGIPLSLADSPQASRERDFINGMIDKCESTQQIKAALVAQYGPRVLALPKDNGFNAAVYIVPVLALILGAGLAVVAVRWWSSREDTAAAAIVPAPSRADTRRLDAEMARWDR
jgi:cytochrome c-type biogenesis protein CcmH